MPNEAVTIYVTKDATTKGIWKTKAAIEGDWARLPDRLGLFGCMGQLLPPRYWSLTFSEAAAQAEDLKAHRLEVLAAQITVIRAIDLTKPVEG